MANPWVADCLSLGAPWHRLGGPRFPALSAGPGREMLPRAVGTQGSLVPSEHKKTEANEDSWTLTQVATHRTENALTVAQRGLLRGNRCARQAGVILSFFASSIEPALDFW